jgi:hypothetical protein
MCFTFPTHFILLDFIILIILDEGVTIMEPPTSFHFICLIFRYSPQYPVLNILNLCSSFNMRDQLSHLYKTTVKIMVVMF